jgi:Domain of unknown function (DUF6285)
MLHEHPTALELAEAVREFLQNEVFPATQGHVQFHTRVAVNALKIIERELRDGPQQEQAHHDRLTALGLADDSELAVAIRDARLDDRHREVVDTVTSAVVAKLAVANPRYMEHPGR